MKEPRCHLCHEKITYCTCSRCLECGELYPETVTDAEHVERCPESN